MDPDCLFNVYVFSSGYEALFISQKSDVFTGTDYHIIDLDDINEYIKLHKFLRISLNMSLSSEILRTRIIKILQNIDCDRITISNEKTSDQDIIALFKSGVLERFYPKIIQNTLPCPDMLSTLKIVMTQRKEKIDISIGPLCIFYNRYRKKLCIEFDRSRIPEEYLKILSIIDFPFISIDYKPIDINILYSLVKCNKYPLKIESWNDNQSLEKMKNNTMISRMKRLRDCIKRRTKRKFFI
jgi:hypothetical protein